MHDGLESLGLRLLQTIQSEDGTTKELWAKETPNGPLTAEVTYPAMGARAEAEDGGGDV